MTVVIPMTPGASVPDARRDIMLQLRVAGSLEGQVYLENGVARFPYAFALGVMGGVLEFIPFVGWLVTATGLVSIAFLTGYAHAIMLLVFIGAWRVTQDYGAQIGSRFRCGRLWR